LKKLLGKPFYDHKKYPVALKLDYTNVEEIKNEIISHVEKSTTFNMTHGPNYSLKVARAVSSEAEILQNYSDAITHLVPHILKWNVNLEDLRTISIKGTNTLELPIYNHLTKEEIQLYFENK